MKKRKKIKFYYAPFFLSVIISAIVLGGFFYGYYLFLSWDTEPTHNYEENIPISTYKPAFEDSVNVLIFGCDERNKPVEFAQLVRLNAETMEMYSVAIPLDEYVTVNVKTQTVAEHYSYGGTADIVKAVENIFLIDIQKYVRVDREAIKSLTDFFGGMEYNFPCDFDSENYSFEKGVQPIDGYRSADILLSGDLFINSDFFTYMFNKYFDAEFETRLSQYYSTFFEYVDTDISRIYLSSLAEPIKLLLQKEERKSIYFDFYAPQDVMEIKKLFA